MVSYWNEFLTQLHTTTPAEWAASFTTIVCIYLTVKNRISNWPWGIVASLLYGWVFWKAHDDANARLQILYYVPICFYGWWVWAKCGPTHNDDLPVTCLSFRVLLGWLAASVVVSLVIDWYIICNHPMDRHPHADSFTTGFSIIAQYLQAKKIFENWWLWIGVDIVYTLYLFPVQHLWPTTVIFFWATILAIQGAIAWKPLIGKAVVPA